MKKTKTLSLLWLMIFATGFSLFAQNQTKNVPLDPKIRYGKLDNGLTYYIMHNEEPKGRASFYIVQNVGAILENDDQNGLAHFLEHMAFNGTKNFPGKGILNYLEQYGVAFGRNINAYTNLDETVYNLSAIPTNKTEVLDSALLILHDWSHYLLLEDKEIDAERGVITEEWRTRSGAAFRMRDKIMKDLYINSQYGKRNIIGDMDIIKNFKYQTLRDYYHKWYRPDLQAIIIIGDIDVDRMEKQVKKVMGEIPMPKNPAERIYYDLPDNKGALFALVTDKEASSSYIHLQFKYDIVKPENKNIDYLKNLYVEDLFSTMISNRINERLQKENPPFIFEAVFFSPVVRTKNAASIYIGFKENEWATALREGCRIVERVRDYGFTKSELERAKTQLIRRLEDQYKKQDKRNNDSYAMEIKDHYLINSPVPGVNYEFDFVKKQIPGVSLDEVNALSKRFFTDDNVLITVSGPEKEGVSYPTKEDVLKIIDDVKNEKLEAYKDDFKAKALISNLAPAGKITATQDIPELDAKMLTLSNGIKVFVKKTDLEKDKVMLTAFSWGGVSMVDDKNVPSAEMLGGFVSNFGIGDFSAVDLRKLLTGKVVKLRPGLNDLSEEISGNASPADLETMFELTYLYFENPRFDEQSFNALKTRYLAFVQNMKNDVRMVFSDSISAIMANHSPRVYSLGEKMIEALDFNAMKNIYQERFKNPGDFFFVISGNFDEGTLNTYIEKYIASLKASPENETYIDRGIRPPAQQTSVHFKREMATPKASVYVAYAKEDKYSEKGDIYMDVISKLLSKRYIDEIREKEGGTYGVGVRASMEKRPYENARLRLMFDCDAEKMEKLKGIALDEIEKLQKGVIDETDLKEAKQNLLKERGEKVQKLSFWHNRLLHYGTDNEFLMTDKEYEDFVNSIDAKTITKVAKKFFKKAVKIEVVMTPEK